MKKRISPKTRVEGEKLVAVATAPTWECDEIIVDDGNLSASLPMYEHK